MIQKILKLFRPNQNTNRLFIDVLREYIDKYLSENNLVPETKTRYEAYFRNITLFLAVEKLQNLPIDEVKIKHAEMFRSWLRINLKTCSIRHASRHVELLKRVTKYAVLMEYCVNDYLSPIKAQRDKPKEIVYLETNEIKKLMVYRFHSDILRIVADLFLFQCFTGLSYSDIYKYNLVQKGDKLWIDGSRSKTDETYIVYFFDEAKVIYDKYQGKLPMLANQTYNSYLKEIAGLLGIKKHLTTHVGRKTHATILNERGVSTKTISMQLGNTERICEQSYVAKSHIRSQNEINRLGLDRNLIAN